MRIVTAPPSKSFSHRMLMAAALADGQSVLHGVSSCDDVLCTRRVLALCGAGVENVKNAVREQENGEYANAGENAASVASAAALTLQITGTGGTLQGGTKDAPLSCNMQESGTSCRFLSALMAAGSGAFRVYGAPRLHERPMAELLQALQKLGADIDAERAGFAPFMLQTKGLQGGNIALRADVSSQFVSALLLAAPRCREGLCVELDGRHIVSSPYIAVTLQVLEHFDIPFVAEKAVEPQSKNCEGGKILWQACAWRELFASGAYELSRLGAVRLRVPFASYHAGEYRVEGDWSGASYLLAAGVLGRDTVRVQGLNCKSVQGDARIIAILQSMGAQIAEENGDIVVSPRKNTEHGCNGACGGGLVAVQLDMADCPDLVPTVAVLAAFAQGTTRIENVAHLRAKESDRLAALAQELTRAGVPVQEEANSLAVTGNPCAVQRANGVHFCTHGDHRLAMALALFRVQGAEISFDTPFVVQKSYPEFWQTWRILCA